MVGDEGGVGEGGTERGLNDWINPQEGGVTLVDVIQLGYEISVVLLHPTDPPTTPVEFLIITHPQGDGRVILPAEPPAVAPRTLKGNPILVVCLIP